jgi:O-antigen/teichoic acid export membrane protein
MFKKVLTNTFSQTFSKVATWIIAIFLISILTNYLSVEMYGLYSKIYNYTGIFVFLADLWLYAISIREITNNQKNSSKIVGSVMTLRFILWVFILVLSTLIAFFLPWYNSNLALISIIICSVFTIIQLLNSSILSLMQANMKIEFSAISIIIWKLVNLWGIAFIAYILYPKWWESDTAFVAIMLIWILWVTVNTLLNYFYAKKITPIHFEFDYEYLKYLFKISLPYWIALFLSVVYFKIDVILLSLIEWPKMWDLSIALYSLPMKIVEVIMVVWWFYMTSILPSLSRGFKELNISSLKTSPYTLDTFHHWGEKKMVSPPSLKGIMGGVSELQHLISISFKVLFAFAFVIFSLWILFRDYIIKIIANENYINTTHIFNSSDAFLVVFWVILFYFISLVFIYTLVAAEKQWKLLKINIFITIFNIVWNIIFIPKYSFIWAWITTILSQILLCVLWYYHINRLVCVKLPWFFILRVIFFWSLISLFWYYLLCNFSFGLYFDFIVYWWLLWLLYILYFFLEYKLGKIIISL